VTFRTLHEGSLVTAIAPWSREGGPRARPRVSLLAPMSRRDQITMTPEEAARFLDEQTTVICATNGPDGWPHLMPLWYVLRDGTVWAWTYAKSQKVRNLDRDRRATLQVEDGDRYEELRGVMLRCEAVVHRDVDEVGAFGTELTARYSGTGVDPAEFREVVRAQAAKRVALEFRERDRVTWDHRKLAGVY
jgi:PPOX class probable F420-dependent enzyme